MIVRKRNDGCEMTILVRRDLAGVPEIDVPFMGYFLSLALRDVHVVEGKTALYYADMLLPGAKNLVASRLPGGRVKLIITKGEA